MKELREFEAKNSKMFRAVTRYLERALGLKRPVGRPRQLPSTDSNPWRSKKKRECFEAQEWARENGLRRMRVTIPHVTRSVTKEYFSVLWATMERLCEPPTFISGD